MSNVMAVEIALPPPSTLTVEVHMMLPRPQNMMSAAELQYIEDQAIIEVIGRYQDGDFDVFLDS